ncbi:MULTISPECIES: hypothetical protein [Hyphomicrobiales]|mgnify:CR=1 FL=1|uniref:Uncharacterized protein n=2 Tax=Prosthecodimorpha TaxID=2981530 RepID=A0A0P6W0B9_9HYPH|nr:MULTISPECIES: hypothetical protein [Hyphomicrobiales]KPL52490.1 hypothetical protein ABB55_09860 [Prosthecomicrobium hirschii]MBT9292060.1 hypothetical protein [Prosthecodimorpha staleyi]MCW1842936.1 hypothetical protein [Prosthecomicrobium hirschii]TPQ49921.1 hypothetical protein C2U72_16040 [Prosthecomicrobium hirschii]
MIRKFATIAAFALVAATATLNTARADDNDFVASKTFESTVSGDDLSAEDRLLIVNGNSGRVVYNDGRNDLFCVTRVVFSHYDYYGRPHYKRTMRCR